MNHDMKIFNYFNYYVATIKSRLKITDQPPVSKPLMLVGHIPQRKIITDVYFIVEVHADRSYLSLGVVENEVKKG
jgi:hypothetical protein